MYLTFPKLPLPKTLRRLKSFKLIFFRSLLTGMTTGMAGWGVGAGIDGLSGGLSARVPLCSTCGTSEDREDTDPVLDRRLWVWRGTKRDNDGERKSCWQ